MNELKHGQWYVCKRWRLLQYLLERGFEPVCTMPDPTNWKYKWWKFENSILLERAIEEFFA